MQGDDRDGLGTDVDTIRKLLRGNPAALSKLDEAVTGKPGNPTGANQYRGDVDNVHINTVGIAKVLILKSSCTMYNLIHQQGTLRKRRSAAFLRMRRLSIAVSWPHAISL
jgi:hypothetical protein